MTTGARATPAGTAAEPRETARTSIAERINAERFALAGWSRAILLQFAHPLVAAAVSEHSSFRIGVFGAAVRLNDTVAAMRRLTFGTPEQSQRTLESILAIHRRVNGRLRHGIGTWPAGAPYSAEDPELVLWVHATLMESLPLVYGPIVAPLSESERDEWCRQGAPLARALGAPDDVPETWAALQQYMAQMYASGRIIVGNTARSLARDVLAPRFSGLVAPARRMNRTITIGLLPARIRDQYGLAWQAADDVPTLLVQARQQFVTGNLQGSAQSYGKVVQLDPTNSEARAYSAWLLVIDSQQKPAETAVPVVSKALDGEIDLDHYRGRSTYPAMAQAAELAIRQAHGLTAVADLQLLDVRGDTVRLRGPDGRVHEAVVAEGEGPEVPPSCGAAPERQRPLIALVV